MIPEKKPFIKRIKKYQLIIAIVLLFALAFFLVYYQAKTEKSTILLIIIIIVFLTTSFLTQELITRFIKVKPPKHHYFAKYYAKNLRDIKNSLREAGFSKTTLPFGTKYNFLFEKTLYKVMVIDDIEAYFKIDDKTDIKPAKEASKATKLVGMEFFNSNDPELIRKISEFNFQSEKMYYVTFYFDVETNEIIWPNYLEPQEENKKDVMRLLEILNLDVESTK